MSDRWATFDCYGTLVDWDSGISATLAELWPTVESKTLLEAYHRLEPLVQMNRDLSYREVTRRCVRCLALIFDLPLSSSEEGAIADGLPSWPVFPEVPEALGALRRSGCKLAVLSNTDPDLLAGSLGRIGVNADLTVVASDIGSYKPAHRHWEVFRELSGAAPSDHIHVAASLFHDIEPCANLRIPAVWINRTGQRSDVSRVAELADMTSLPATISQLWQ